MQKLAIIRGIPGAGKSTYAQRLVMAENYDEICEIDEGWYSRLAEGTLDSEQIDKFLSDCYQRALAFLQAGKSVVVVSTFIKRSELERFMSLTERFPKLRLKIIRVTGTFKNPRHIPTETVAQLRKELQYAEGERFYNPS